MKSHKANFTGCVKDILYIDIYHERPHLVFTFMETILAAGAQPQTPLGVYLPLLKNHTPRS